MNNHRKKFDLTNDQKIMAHVLAIKAKIEAFKDNAEMLRYSCGVEISEGLHRLSPPTKNADGSKKKVYTTTAAAEQKASGKKPTPEHFYGRASSAMTILEQALKGKSDRFLCALIKSRSRVHDSTSDENKALNKYMKENPGVHWRTAYKSTCSPLIEKIDGRKKKAK
jgi:hypothetical protein